MALAVASFTLLLLPLLDAEKIRSPIALVLACLLFCASGPMIFALLPGAIQWYVALLPVVFFLFLPGFWFYHQSLIASYPWRWHKGVWPHFVAAAVMVLVGLMILALPEDDFLRMFFSDDGVESAFAGLLSLLFFVAVIAWCVISCAYIAAIVKSTARYRQQLQQVYSHHQGRSLNWVLVTCALIAINWVYALLVLAFDQSLAQFGINETGCFVLLTLLTWFVAGNGLRQTPALADQVVLPEGDATPAEPVRPAAKLYQRSALAEADLKKIAAKLVTAVEDDQVHLEPDLSLKQLAKHIGEAPQYISQTFSQELETTFFEFINLARVEHARHLLQETDDAIVNIAMEAGFNSRSAFYKAFKQITSMTPSQYRKAKEMGSE
jgi:AraC-like DNA-binding protein